MEPAAGISIVYSVVGLLLAEIGFGCTTRADVNDFSGLVGSSAKGSNLMKGGGFRERIEDDLRRPPDGAGLANEAGLVLAKAVAVVAIMEAVGSGV